MLIEANYKKLDGTPCGSSRSTMAQEQPSTWSLGSPAQGELGSALIRPSNHSAKDGTALHCRETRQTYKIYPGGEYQYSVNPFKNSDISERGGEGLPRRRVSTTNWSRFTQGRKDRSRGGTQIALTHRGLVRDYRGKVIQNQPFGCRIPEGG